MDMVRKHMAAPTTIAARTFGPAALATDVIVVCPPAAYTCFKLAHLGCHAAMDTLVGPEAGHAFDTRDAARPQAWPAQWTAPTPLHATFLADVYPWWGPRDDGALGCIVAEGGSDPSEAGTDGQVMGLGEHVPLRAAAAGVPRILAALLDDRVAANPLLDMRMQFSALTVRTVLALRVAAFLPAGAAPALCSARGATALAHALDPLACHDGHAVALWRLPPPPSASKAVAPSTSRAVDTSKGSGPQLLHCVLPDDLAVCVGSLVLRLPVVTQVGEGTLLLCTVHADCGTLHAGWGDGTLPQRVLTAARGGRAVTDFDGVVVPWVPQWSARSRMPALEGLVHPQWADERKTGAAVVEGAALHVQWAWNGVGGTEGAEGTDGAKTNATRAERDLRLLALCEDVCLGVILCVGEVALVASVLPGHVLGRRAAASAGPPLHLTAGRVTPWGRQ